MESSSPSLPRILTKGRDLQKLPLYESHDSAESQNSAYGGIVSRLGPSKWYSMTPPSRIGSTCAAPNCYSTVLLSATRFCTLHQSLMRASSSNNQQNATSQSGTSRPPGKVLTAKRGRGYSFWGAASRSSVKPQEPSRESSGIGGDAQAKQSAIAQSEKGQASVQILTQRVLDNEGEKGFPSRRQNTENAARNQLSEKTSSINRPINAALQTTITESLAGPAKEPVTARINLPKVSELPETTRIGSQTGTGKLVNVPHEYVVAERTKAPVANMQLDLHVSRESKSDTKPVEHVPLSLPLEKISSPTAQDSREPLLNMLKPVFVRELNRAQELSSRTKVSTNVFNGTSKPPEVTSQSKNHGLEQTEPETATYYLEASRHAESEVTGTEKASLQTTLLENTLSNSGCHLPWNALSGKEVTPLEQVQSVKNPSEKETPSLLATKTVRISPIKTLPTEALPEEPSPEQDRSSPGILPEVRPEIGDDVNMADVSDIPDGVMAQSTEAVLSPLRDKVDTGKKNLLVKFDPIAFDSMIYRHSRLRPPPGISLYSRVVKNGLSLRSNERVYLPVNPAIHKMHKRSEHWYKEKCEEIRRRPNRKAWFGKVMARKRWLLAEEIKSEESRQEARRAGTMPSFKPPEPRSVKQILDFGDVPEEELPEHVRNNPAWMKACAWLRGCEKRAIKHRRQVDKSRKEAERYFERIAAQVNDING
ncbi:hypothetical protein FLONG3_7742 [Fusarium longipes]|uniref:Uncharacterized protein n=1 Tax=Fusarium longipes TaxID=694270 RepID=A0A395SBE9_9HYPO|nr:hypothetical protein FLONG3_7742 [Fusarium longipes]